MGLHRLRAVRVFTHTFLSLFDERANYDGFLICDLRGSRAKMRVLTSEATDPPVERLKGKGPRHKRGYAPNQSRTNFRVGIVTAFALHRPLQEFNVHFGTSTQTNRTLSYGALGIRRPWLATAAKKRSTGNSAATGFRRTRERWKKNDKKPPMSRVRRYSLDAGPDDDGLLVERPDRLVH